MALHPYPLSKHHAVHDTLLHDVHRLDSLRETRCLLRQRYRYQGDGVDCHDVLWICRSDQSESGPQHSRDLSSGENVNDTLCDSDANDIL